MPDQIHKTGLNQIITMMSKGNCIKIDYSAGTLNIEGNINPQIEGSILKLLKAVQDGAVNGKGNGEVQHEDLKGLLDSNNPYYMHTFAAYEPVTLKRDKIQGSVKDRLWVGVIDGIIIVGNKLIITDYKPKWNMEIGTKLGKHMANVFPQLTALGLKIIHELGDEMEVWCMPYNKDGAYLFKPKWMFNELETFLNGQYALHMIGDGWDDYHLDMKDPENLKDKYRKFFEDFRDLVK